MSHWPAYGTDLQASRDIIRVGPGAASRRAGRCVFFFIFNYSTFHSLPSLIILGLSDFISMIKVSPVIIFIEGTLFALLEGTLFGLFVSVSVFLTTTLSYVVILTMSLGIFNLFLDINIYHRLEE
jgi:hypothetical protein